MTARAKGPYTPRRRCLITRTWLWLTHIKRVA